MSSALITIGRSGAAAARAGLELTAQNIANAGSSDYSRRSLGQSELIGSATIAYYSSTSYGGVRLGDVRRADNVLAREQVRASASDLARADAELAGLRGAETALEQSRLYEGLVDFEAALTRLASDPLDPSLRISALESARQLAETFQVANTALGHARDLARSQVAFGVDEVNSQATALARINDRLTRTEPNTAGHAALLDQRDAALAALSDELGISVSFGERGIANVRLGTASGPLLVDGTSATSLSSNFAADGTASFDLGGSAVAPATGALAGRASALAAQADLQTQLDAIALSTITRANSGQASGAAQDGSAGQPLFSGTGAGDIALALGGPSGLATAPSGAPANSRDAGNLAALIAAIGADDGPVAGSDALLLGLSSRISGQQVTRSALATIAQSSQSALLIETGVDLDAEATNLIRLQQAFEANSRIIQVATQLFDTILALR
ncbi:flagellar hook-associated protein FlgK [Erythrobacter sp. JK5]|uniref:flagellar hook-associated protein FlgK n=1 Tax=Erythrobacter sp. JK5 TaxID=2829500 RepID=UPI001BA8E3F5|nr:flagellar hook-associated protein FlgK [Erythrobacter sp. JK5]QUL36920.1 flagellar hook-associated protein FlgK [Erythrobacter sp. JK5]